MVWVYYPSSYLSRPFSLNRRRELHYISHDQPMLCGDLPQEPKPGQRGWHSSSTVIWVITFIPQFPFLLSINLQQCVKGKGPLWTFLLIFKHFLCTVSLSLVSTTLLRTCKILSKLSRGTFPSLNSRKEHFCKIKVVFHIDTTPGTPGGNNMNNMNNIAGNIYIYIYYQLYYSYCSYYSHQVSLV